MTTEIRVTPTFLSAGCSRQPAGAVWSRHDHRYYYAANKQILVAAPSNDDDGLVVDPSLATFTGHTQPIRALALLDATRLVSVAADRTLRIWSTTDANPASRLLATLPVGAGPAHVVTAQVFADQAWIVAADTLGHVVAYMASPAHSNEFTLAHSWTLRRYAVAAAMHTITPPPGLATGDSSAAEGLVLALSTADSLLHLYLLDTRQQQFTRTLTLSGHENWVTALDFVTVPDGEWTRAASGLHAGDVLLASGSMDKFLRIWRLTFWDSLLHPNMTAQEEEADQKHAQDGDDDDEDENQAGKQPLVKAVVTDDNTDELLASMLASLQQDGQLSTKAHLVAWPPGHASATVAPPTAARHPPLHVYLDSVLFGHDDWIHSVAWSPTSPTLPLRLASSSADKSILVWSLADGATWTTQARVGELGGSVLSMHTVQWSPAGSALAATGYSGAVHLWSERPDTHWRPQARSPSGHVGAVRDLTWDPLGHVLLTTSADQTTRVWARPRSGGGGGGDPVRRVWAEWARPQIHGYDLQALAFADARTLVAAADEKVVRVFGVPRGFARAMHRAGVVASPHAWGTEDELVALGANLPALGLSNKPVTASAAAAAATGDQGEYLERQSYSATAASAAAMLEGSGGGGDGPPLEEHLLQQTLWPELDKLYGHGHECVAVAGSAVRAQVLTTCKATSPEHAGIRVYDARTWQEVQVLDAHALTVTAVRAAPKSGKWVVSAGRDRAWCLWAWHEGRWELRAKRDKAHARIIWDVAWSGDGEEWFVTASRDKSAKVWRLAGDGHVDLAATLAAPAAVTGVAVHSPAGGSVAVMALGLESGVVQVMRCDDRAEGKVWVQVAEIRAHTDAIHAIAWHVCEDLEGVIELASCSEDGSVRVYEVTGI